MLNRPEMKEPCNQLIEIMETYITTIKLLTSTFVGRVVHSSNIRYFIYSRRSIVEMMKSKTTVALSTAAIAAVALLFAAGPIVGTQQALAYGWGWHGGWHHGWGWHVAGV